MQIACKDTHFFFKCASFFEKSVKDGTYVAFVEGLLGQKEHKKGIVHLNQAYKLK